MPSFDSDRIHALAVPVHHVQLFNPDFWAINAIFVLNIPCCPVSILYMSLETACARSLTRSGFCGVLFSQHFPALGDIECGYSYVKGLGCRPCRNSFYHHLHAEALPALHIERLIGTLYLRSVVEAVEQAGEGHVSLYYIGDLFSTDERLDRNWKLLDS